MVTLKLPKIEQRQEYSVPLEVLATPPSSKSTIVDYKVNKMQLTKDFLEHLFILF